MKEGQPRSELSDEALLGSVYSRFKKLAIFFGERTRENGELDSYTSFKTFKTSIPPDSNLHGHPDSVTGKYFGFGVGIVEIFYRKGEEAGQITLSKSTTGRISLRKTAIFKLNHKGGYYTYDLNRDKTAKPDIAGLNELLEKVEEKLRVEGNTHSEPQVPLSDEQKEARAVEAQRRAEIERAKLDLKEDEINRTKISRISKIGARRRRVQRKSGE